MTTERMTALPTVRSAEREQFRQWVRGQRALALVHAETVETAPAWVAPLMRASVRFRLAYADLLLRHL